MKVSEQGFDLIREFEGFKSIPYLCHAGKLTIGYGHVINDKDRNIIIDRDDAILLLKNDIKDIENTIDSLVKVSITQGQFDALASLIYNWGTGKFKSSLGLQKLNTGDYKAAADEFFSKTKGVVTVNGKFSSGLYRRRQAEEALWYS